MTMMVRVAIALVALQAISACSAGGRRLVPPPQVINRFVLEERIRDRWLQPAQRPEFTPYVEALLTMHLDVPSEFSPAGERTIQVGMRTPSLGDRASLVVRRDGRIVGQAASLLAAPPAAVMPPGDSARLMRFRLLVGGRLALPLARTWDVVPRVHPRRFSRGERWTDTIALATGFEGSRQTLEGHRTSVLIGDTLVGGRHLWIVRDSATVRYSEHELQEERTLDTLVAIDRIVTGTTRSRYLLDRDLGLFWQREDTTSLAGDAVLHYPDGRSFRTPVRYERTRQWTLYTLDAYNARQAQVRAELERTSSGTVRYPSTELQRRLSSGDAILRDSLLTVWERERDPNHREDVYRTLQLWARGAPAIRDQLEARRIATGDSAFLVERLFRRAYPAQPPIERDEAEQMIRVMSDPGVAFALGVSRDALYENLVQTFVTWPRALMPDSTRWRCVADACRLFEAQWREAREARLRDVGLAALVTRDPAGWADSAIARAATGSHVIVSAAELANGVGATWPAAAKVPLPAPNADWRAWRAWSNSPAPGYRPTPMFGMQPDMRVEASHVNAIRMYEVRTGRDVVAELRRDLAAATEDSARMVFGAILIGLGDRPTVDQVAAQFRSGSAPQIELAQRSLRGLFQGRAPLADSATQIAVLDRLLSVEVEGGVPWPSLMPPRKPVPLPPNMPRAPAVTPARYVLADSVPRALREKWRDRVRFIGVDEWQRMSDRDAATLLTLSSVERVGPFLRVQTSTAGRSSRAPNEMPWLFFGSSRYYLLADGDGWVIVSLEMSMT